MPAIPAIIAYSFRNSIFDKETTCRYALIPQVVPSSQKDYLKTCPFGCPKGFVSPNFLWFIVAIHPYKLTTTVENYGYYVDKRQRHVSFINGNIVSKIKTLYYALVKNLYN